MSYMALIWNPAHPDTRQAALGLLHRFRANAPGWRTIVDQDGLVVLCAEACLPPDRIYLLPAGQGVILGRLFRNSGTADFADAGRSAPDLTVFNERASDSLIASQGRSLVTDYWGQYVAFLHEPGSRRSWVLRDPTGAIPCHHACIDGVSIYFLRVEDCECAAALPASIDLHYLLGYLLYDSVCVRETGLAGVENVLAGECIEHCSDRRIRTFYWNPLAIAEGDQHENPVEATAVMRQTVITCIHAWASCFDRIVLRLSGGLDSSIVLAALDQAPGRPSVLCLNNYCPGSAAADERSFARSAAARAGRKLIEWEADPEFSLEGVRELPRALAPYPCISSPRALQREVRFLHTTGAAAVFTGAGGDEVFYRSSRLPVTTDHAWRHGLSLSLLKRAFDDALASNRSLWKVLRPTLRYGWLRHPWSMAHFVSANYRPLMPLRIKQEAQHDKTLWHPLYRETARMAPMKYCQAYTFTLSTGRIYIPGVTPYPAANIAPLLSQPLFELSLRIPTYILKRGGRDRAVARDAFSDLIPPSIAVRNSKGTDTEFIRTLAARNMDLLREMLPDGFLVQQGLLDPAALEKVLSGTPTRIQTHISELFDYLTVEAWARSWLKGRSSAAPPASSASGHTCPPSPQPRPPPRAARSSSSPR